MDVQRTDGIYRRLTTLNEPFFNQVFILVSFNLVLPFLSHIHTYIYIFIKNSENLVKLFVSLLFPRTKYLPWNLCYTVISGNKKHLFYAKYNGIEIN